jgi:cytochrome c
MKKFVVVLAVVFMMISSVAFAIEKEEKVTPQDVYDMVLNAVQVLETLGDEGMDAFSDKEGEFFKGSLYITVWNCDEKRMVFHINPKLIEMREKAWDLQGKKGVYLGRELCAASKNPNGGWVEYWWPKPGETEPSRKITFIVQVPGRPYQVTAGIYDETTIENLKKQFKE